MVIECEVVVVGAGPAGLACASRLVDLDVGRVVIAPLRARARPWGETLAPRAQGWLDALGRGDALALAGAIPSTATITAWGEPIARSRPSILSPEGPAWHVDRGAFDRALTEGLEGRGVRRLAGERLRGVEAVGEGLRVITDREAITARAVVDATGGAALAARRLGARRLVADRLLVLSTRAVPVDPEAPALAVEAAADGWWYASPTPGGASVVWVTDPQALGGRRPAVAARESWAQLGLLPGHARLVDADPWSARTLTLGALDRPGGPGWLAIGDAAFTPDPMAGMGVTDALEDGVCAAEALARALAGEVDAIDREVARLRARARDHLEIRDGFLAAEDRFADRPFWRSRRAASEST